MAVKGRIYMSCATHVPQFHAGLFADHRLTAKLCPACNAVSEASFQWSAAREVHEAVSILSTVSSADAGNWANLEINHLSTSGRHIALLHCLSSVGKLHQSELVPR